MKICQFTVFSFSLLFGAAVNGAETNTLAKPLEALRPFLGKTWKGQFKDSTPEKPMFDVQRWERALNGKAVRILHSVNDGRYGGESIVMPNPKTAKLEFHYFSTAGFVTKGTMDIEGRKLITHEEVTGEANGATKVKATTELLADGKLRVQSSYYKQGAWEEGRDMTYIEAPDAEVRFR